jgi:hypothetical protein
VFHWLEKRNIKGTLAVGAHNHYRGFLFKISRRIKSQQECLNAYVVCNEKKILSIDNKKPSLIITMSNLNLFIFIPIANVFCTKYYTKISSVIPLE